MLLSSLYSQETGLIPADYAQADIYNRLSVINDGLSIVERAMPPEMDVLLARIHEAIAELVAIMDCLVMGESVLLSTHEFSEIYRSKLSQLTLRLYLLQQRACDEHQALLHHLQDEVMHLGEEYPL